MSTSTRTQHRIELEPGQMAELQRLAAKHGYFHLAGPGTGKVGSVSAFLRAIATGKVIVKSILSK